MLTDEGLAAHSGEQELDFDQYLKGKYSITQVTVGRASHLTADYGELGAPIVATVRFYGFEDGQEPIQVSTTDDLRKGGETISLNGDKKAKWLTIEYSSPELQAASGYALGLSFEAGEVELTLQLDKQEGGSGVLPITKITNTAKATLKYRPGTGRARSWKRKRWKK